MDLDQLRSDLNKIWTNGSDKPIDVHTFAKVVRAIIEACSLTSQRDRMFLVYMRELAGELKAMKKNIETQEEASLNLEIAELKARLDILNKRVEKKVQV